MTRRNPRPFRSLLAGAVVAITAAALAGCIAVPTASAPTPAASVTRTPPATPLGAPTPTSTATPSAAAVPIEQQIAAGPVADGVSATATGTGPAMVDFVRQGDIAIVVQLDCSACTGLTNLTAPGRMSPLGEAPAPMSGSYLVDVFKDTAPEQSVELRTEGSWTMTLISWNDTPLVSGPQSGTGSTVLFFADDVGAMDVTYTPSGEGDSFSGRVFTTSDDPQLFGNDEAFTETYTTDLPGVMAITTNGTWTVTPHP